MFGHMVVYEVTERYSKNIKNAFDYASLSIEDED